MTTPTLQKFETALEQFENACNQGATLTELMYRLRDAVSIIAPLDQIKAAVVEGARLIPIGEKLTEAESSELAAAFASAQSHQNPHSAIFTDRSLLFMRALSRDHRLIIQFGTRDDPHKNALLADATRALTDCFAVAVNRDLASNLYERLQDREVAGSFLREIHAAGTFQQCARKIVDLSSGLLCDGRVTVLVSDSDQLQVVAATGVRMVDRTADAVQQIETFARFVVTGNHTGRWIETGDLNPTGIDTKQLSWFAMNGIRAVRIQALPLKPNDDAIVRRVFVMIEIFEGQSSPSENRVEFLIAQAALAIHSIPDTASTKSSIAWLRTTRQRSSLAAFLAALLLTFVPADFEVEVSGQLFPVERYRVFAPDHGIVEDLAVNADETVNSGEFLLRLQNAEQDLERSRLLGEIDFASSRLQAIRATRSLNGSIPGSENNRSADLSSEEQQLEQKLASLREEQLLVDQQMNSLSRHSPIAGVVYQRRLKERLESRPVQRGQLLMEIVNSNAEWQLELQMPENVVGYVRNSADVRHTDQSQSAGLASEKSQVGHAVRFWLNSQPSISFQTTTDSLEQSAHIDEQRLTCLATAPCRGLNTEQLRPGQSVTARIHCGRRSLGFVLFREVIEYLQKKRFAWL
ncbi:MAG: hypothetical protein O2856_09685 [Planctomycetota bacterium]|nr:hypothetical protein [Planctomycetota bacterium]